jgi:NAD+ synthase (glutamine-hydrolysing)
MNTFTRFCLAQINPTVGDVAGNAAKIIAAIDRARAQGADVAAFPELALSGYPPEDLLLRNSFIQLNNHYLKEIIKASQHIVSIVGFPFQEKGKLYNAAAVINKGSLKYVYQKMFLPNYGVFDEKRYFQPGHESAVYLLGNKLRFAVNICEDIWEDSGPFNEQAVCGKAQVIVNISSSPYHAGKINTRQQLACVRARQTGCYILYCNLVGGQDELVFDGGSFAVSPSGKVIVRAKTFDEDLLFADIPMPMAPAKRAIRCRVTRRVREIRLTGTVFAARSRVPQRI